MANPTVQKAYIKLKQGSVSGGAGGGSLGEVQFQFNPKEYSVKKSAKWERKPAKGAKTATMPEFKGADPSTMSIECFLDGTEPPKRDIVKDLETLFKCCKPGEQSLGNNKPSPPFVTFGWGETMSFNAIVKSVNAKYTMFTPDGKPVRAIATVELEELPAEASRQNPTSGGLAARRSHTVVTGDSLQSVAYREYQNPGLWRALAHANDIDDPMRLRIGTHLMVPPPEEAILHA